MKKGNKILIALTLSGIIAGGAYFASNEVYKSLVSSKTYAISNINKENPSNIELDLENRYTYINKIFEDDNTNEVVLENKPLETALKSILDVDILRVNSISAHDDYKETETEPGSGVFVANKTSLDLSNTGVTDITELCLFNIPSTLKAINLAENNITNEDFANIVKFTNIKASDNIEYNGKTITSIANLDLIITKINLCFNDINLKTLHSSELTSSKFIFGIQRLYNIHESRLVQKHELDNCYYYFKNDDFNYISPVFKRNDISVGFIENAITGITSSETLGKYLLSIRGMGDGSTSYFGNWSNEEEFTVFTAKIDDNYFIEKTKGFKLPNDKLIFDGLNPEWVITGSPGTNKTGTFKVNIILTYNGVQRLICRLYC